MRKLLLGTLLAASVSILSAGTIITEEAPGQTTSTVAGATNIVTFNALSAGAFSGSTSIGTYTKGGTIVSPGDEFSGDASNYIAVGSQSGGAGSYSVGFNGQQTYFGFLWNALDSSNSFTLFDNGTAVLTLNSSNFTGLAAGYLGNPSTKFKGQDGSEDFFFINIFATGNTVFTSATFSNGGNTGFETDNHTLLASTVPEPSTYGMLFAGLSALGFVARRRSARKA